MRHLYQHYSTTSAISVLLRCNSDVSFPILGYLNRAKISWAIGGGTAAPAASPLNTPLTACTATAQVCLFLYMRFRS